MIKLLNSFQRAETRVIPARIVPALWAAELSWCHKRQRSRAFRRLSAAAKITEGNIQSLDEYTLVAITIVATWHILETKIIRFWAMYLYTKRVSIDLPKHGPDKYQRLIMISGNYPVWYCFFCSNNLSFENRQSESLALATCIVKLRLSLSHATLYSAYLPYVSDKWTTCPPSHLHVTETRNISVVSQKHLRIYYYKFCRALRSFQGG